MQRKVLRVQLRCAEGAAAKAQGAFDQAKDTLPDISVLEGLKVNKKGEIVNEEGDPIARVSGGELSDFFFFSFFFLFYVF